MVVHMQKKDKTFFASKEPGVLQVGDARMALFDIKSGFWSIRRQMLSMVGIKLTNTALQQSGVNGGASFAKSIGRSEDPVEQGNLFKNCVQAYQDAGFGKFEIINEKWPIGEITISARNAI